jgi:predicted GTPase
MIINAKKPITIDRVKKLMELNSKIFLVLETGGLNNTSLRIGSNEKKAIITKNATRLLRSVKGVKRTGRMPLKATLTT